MANSPGIFPPTSASAQDCIKTCLLLGQRHLKKQLMLIVANNSLFVPFQSTG